jgi:hypothetical protein
VRPDPVARSVECCHNDPASGADGALAFVMHGLSKVFRPIARRMLDRVNQRNPVECQRTTLMELVREATATRFGRAYGFADIGGVDDFQARVPLRDYERFREEFWGAEFPLLNDVSWPGRIPFFALTSGTTSGHSKRIPVSNALIRSNRRAATRVLMRHIVNHPASELLDGRFLLLGGATDLEEEAPGVWSGDLSGIAASEIPWWLAPLVYPKRDVALIPDWDRRIATMLADPESRKVRAIAGQSTWLLSFVERAMLADGIVGSDIRNSFPLLELILCGGVNFAPYRDRFEALSPSGKTELREVYVASEGFIAIGDGTPGRGMRPLLDNGIFFEFVPLEELGARCPTRHWIATVELGRDYAIAVSTNAGVWAYLIGDIVRFVEVKPPRLIISGRTGQVLSAFGERLIEAEITDSVTAAAARGELKVAEFLVGPVFPKTSGGPGRHLFVIEFAHAPPDEAACEKLAERIDILLKSTNYDYNSMRSGGLVIERPKVYAVGRGTFERWMKLQGKVGGQNKMPRILLDPGVLEDFQEFALGSGE